MDGEPCWFRHDPRCPGGWNWALPANHRHAQTAHHLDRIMDGGDWVADPDRMAPAHRGCNARDGLRAQNARRAGAVTHVRRWVDARECTSRTW